MNRPGPSPAPTLSDLEDNLTRWGEPGAFAVVSPGWEESMAAMPAEFKGFDPAFLKDAREFGGLDSSWDEPLIRLGRKLRNESMFAALAWHAWRHSFLEGNVVDFASWPNLERALGKDCRVFYLAVALWTFEITRHKHRSLGVPERVTRATCRDVVPKCGRSALDRPDLPGLAPRELNWLRNHTNGNVFTIGRLQYWPRPFRGGAEVFRHRTSGCFLALAPDGLEYDSNGLRPLHEASPETTWTAALTRTEEEIRGHPIATAGRAAREPVFLRANEWEAFLSEDQIVYDIHIPAGGGMGIERCRESLVEARGLLPAIFPELAVNAFACQTWFLGPQIPAILPPDSNIVRFRQSCNLFPISTSARDGLYFLFGQHGLPERLPENATSLQMAVWKHIKNGGDWRGGGMFLPVEQAHLFGKSRP